MSAPLKAKVEAPTPQSVTPYGWLLGKPFPDEPGAVAFGIPTSGFRSEHIFQPGKDGETEVLWVDYSNADPLIGSLERHHVTQQAVVPLTADIIQVVALSDADGAPDLVSIRAFRLSPGIGLCMRPGIWHATRSEGAACLMLTRRSTTLDLVSHLKNCGPPSETSLRDIPPIRLIG